MEPEKIDAKKGIRKIHELREDISRDAGKVSPGIVHKKPLRPSDY